MHDNAAIDDGRYDVAQAGMGFELIFASLEVLARFEHEHAADEDPRLIDHSFARQHVGNVANSGAARDIHDPIIGKRTGSVEPLLAGNQRDAAHHGEQDKNADDRVADNDKRMPCAF